MVYTRIIPLGLLAAVAAIIIKIILNSFENWLIKTVRKSKQKRKLKEYSGMTDDQVLDTPHCPICNRMMKLRTARKDGNQFWGCSAFPNCRGIRQV